MQVLQRCKTQHPLLAGGWQSFAASVTNIQDRESSTGTVPAPPAGLGLAAKNRV